MKKIDRFSLQGRTALVTGASRGLGKAIALAFAQAGASVALVARGEEALEATAEEILNLGPETWAFSYDLLQIEGIDNLFRAVLAATGGVDILANVAGTTFQGEAASFPLSEWRRILDVNLTAPFVLSQCFARSRIEQGRGGKVINIASLASEVVRPSLTAYAASKGGIRQLTRALAVEWAPHHINVNAIGPGYFATELTQPMVEDEEFSAWVKQQTPLGRWGVPDDVTGVAVFLASSASDFITGQIIYVDGGWLAHV